MAEYSSVRYFEPKSNEIDWREVLAIDVPSFQEGRRTERDIKEILDNVLPKFLNGFISRRSVEASQPEKLLHLFRVTQLLLELVNQDFECVDDELENLRQKVGGGPDPKKIDTMSKQMQDMADQMELTTAELRERNAVVKELEKQKADLLRQCEELVTDVGRAEEELAEKEKEALQSIEVPAQLPSLLHLAHQLPSLIAIPRLPS